MVNATNGLDTFPKLLVHNAKTFALRPAMRHKDFGIWQTWSWAEMLEEIRAFSLGLQAIGLKKGDKVAVVGSNRPALYWSFAAVQALGGVPIPVYADAVADEMVYVLQGEVTLYEGDESVVIRSGDAATFKAGDPIGHCLQNRSNTEARYLVIGTRSSGDVVTYPDHDRVLHFDRATESRHWTDHTGSPADSPYKID